MALPVLGIVARLISAKGFKVAVKKYGRKAAEKGTKEIEKRDKAIIEKVRAKSPKAKTAAERQAQYTSPRQTEIARETKKIKARDKRLVKERDSMLDKEGALIPEVPLKFSEGGKAGAIKEQMEGLAIAITPITVEKKRAKKQEGGLLQKSIDFSKGHKKIIDTEADLPEGMFLNEDGKYELTSEAQMEIYKDKLRKSFLYQEQWREGEENRVKKRGEELRKKYSEWKEEKGLKSLEKEISESLKRKNFQEGGDVDTQMNDLMPVEEIPIAEEAVAPMPEEAQMPDEQMEDEYLDFVVSQSLSPEEETELMNKLEADPALSIMFDKIMDTAMEFSGAGPVEGPGSEVSDSIPARLSDGEFVFTAKATDQIGADRLQSMMEDAEVESDVTERQEIAVGGEVEDEPAVDQYGKPVDEDITAEEIKKSMLSINPRLQ